MSKTTKNTSHSAASFTFVFDFGSLSCSYGCNKLIFLENQSTISLSSLGDDTYNTLTSHDIIADMNKADYTESNLEAVQMSPANRKLILNK